MWVCRLPVHIDPAGCTAFTEILGEFVTSHWADRVVGPYGEASMHTYPVGADDSVRPQDAPLLTEIFGEIATSRRADVGIGPYNQIRRCIRIRRGFPITPCIPPGGAEPRPYQVLCEVVLLCGF